jgi:hypothetical protein
LLPSPWRPGNRLTQPPRTAVPRKWLATFADPLRAQSAIDRFVNNAYDLVIAGESYRKRQKPTLDAPPAATAEKTRRGSSPTMR